MNEMLQVKDLTVDRGVQRVLSQVSLLIEKGQMVAITGGNGAGKTTLLRTISGLVRPSSGTIYFEGRRIDHLTPSMIVRLGIIHVSEGRNLFPKMTVLENLKLGAITPHARERMGETLQFVFEIFPTLRTRCDQRAGTLNGGEQQMLAIARGLMGVPKLLMLDEPFKGLDPKMAQHLIHVLEDIKSGGVTLLLADPNVSEVARLVGRTYVLEAGRILFEGNAERTIQELNVR